jgi:hypothetical protein
MFGIGIGIGIGRQRFASGIFSAYAARVAADGGVTEAGACVDAVSALLQTASLLLVPSGYKSGNVYSQIPTNGNGDLTFTRASTANRTNSSGNIELMATGVPRLDYSQGSCPALLLEPQRTNSIRNSTMVGAVAGSPGTLPTNWVISNAGLTQTIVGVGTELGLPYVDIRLNGTASNAIFNLFTESPTQVVASNGQTWTNSFYMKLVAAPNPYNLIQSNFSERTAAGSFLTGGQQTITLTSTLTRFTFTRTNTNALTERINAGYQGALTIAATYDFTIRIAAPQLELGAYATTYIPTTTATVTRIADAFTRDNIYTNNLITSSGGTWFVELRGNIAYTRDGLSTGLFLDTVDYSYTNGINIRNSGGGSTRLSISKWVSGSGNILYTTTTDTTKIAIKWNGSTADVFANGTKVVSATSFTPTAMQFLKSQANQIPIFIQQMALYPTPLSDSDCIALTTL